MLIHFSVHYSVSNIYHLTQNAQTIDHLLERHF